MAVFQLVHGTHGLLLFLISFRQCLIGGNYGLLNITTKEPNPDYWIALFYRQFFSSVFPSVTYMSVSVSHTVLDTGVKVFCVKNTATSGQYGFILINLSNEDWDIDLKLSMLCFCEFLLSTRWQCSPRMEIPYIIISTH
jgi:hypothetical protein